MKLLPCLLIAGVVLCPGLSLLGQSSTPPDRLNSNQQFAHDLFKELIEINTTLNIGCTKAAEAMAARFRAAGLPESDIQLVGPSSKHMNLVVRLHGSGASKPVLFIGHLDVVEALRGDWSVDPFVFLEKDGYFYGRGTTDMKCEDADLVANFIRLKQEGFVPARDLILALTDDEENGDANGVDWLVQHRRDLVEAEYCINPDGGGGELKKGKHIVMEVQTSEKVYIDYRLEARNKGGHSSLPVKDNAIYRLAAALTRVGQYDFPIRLNETTRRFFAESAAQESGQLRADMLAMQSPSPDSAAANRLAHASPYYNSLLRTTIVATLLSGGHAPNALPQLASANINCRMLPDDTPENVLATLRRLVADSAISISVASAPKLSPLSPLRPDITSAVQSVTDALWPGVTLTPIMSTGASDGVYLRGNGIPVYGISGMFTDIDDIRAHGRDERIGTTEFYEGVEFMYRLMKIVGGKR